MIRLFAVGNVVREPILASTKNGEAVCNFTVAANSTAKIKDDQKKATYIRLTAWGKLAEICSQYLAKGRQVSVTCKDLVVETYQKKDGGFSASISATLDDIEFLTSRNYAKYRAENPPSEEYQGKPAEKKAEPQPSPNDFMEGFVDVSDEDMPL